ncbi:MAG: hypothetical protein AAF692_08115, partial [Pseudomonadota bacterium]
MDAQQRWYQASNASPGEHVPSVSGVEKILSPQARSCDRLANTLTRRKRIVPMATQLKPTIECSPEEWQARLDLAACYRI